MTEIQMADAAAAALEGLYDANDPMAEAVDQWLDAIERDPGAAAVKRHRIRPGKVWAIVVRDPRGQEDWMILWEQEDSGPVVHYLGVNTLVRWR
jgi:hypothetical protein